MDVFATDLDMTNFMKIGSDYDNGKSIIKELYSKVESTKNTVSQVFQSYNIFMKIKEMIKSGATVEGIKDRCQQYADQGWVSDFKEDLSNCTASLKTTQLDQEKAYASLTACYDKAFLRLFGMQLLANSLYSLFQSFKMWTLINTFIVSSYDNRIKSAKEKLNECARICKPMIDLEVLNQEQVKDLKRVQELLGDIKSIIEFIREDVTNKIAEAKRLRSNSYLSGALNFISAFFGGLIFNKVADAIGDDSRSGIATKLSTVVHFGCTIGDLIHAGKANLLVEQLEKQLETMKQLEDEQKRLEDVYEKLSTVPVQV